MHARIIGLALALLILAVPSFAAQSFLGSFSGNIVTPDAVVAPLGTWEVSFHDFIDVVGGEDLTSFGVIYGLAENLEVGLAALDNGDSEIAFSGKLGIVTETSTTPAVLVGVFDIGSTVADDASFYVALSKNITSLASDVADQPSRPLRLTAGFGSGVFDGFFAGFHWTLTPRLSLMAEYLNEGFEGDNDINAGIRYAATSNVRLDLALIDFEELALGASLTSRF